MEKNIKDYLHFYLGCDVYVFPDSTLHDGWLEMRLKEMPNLQYKYTLTVDNFNRTIERQYKPILRKLDSLTKEECDDLDWYYEGTDGAILRHSAENLSPEEFQYLLSKGFDLFGLIESGLAIDLLPSNLAIDKNTIL